MQEGAVFNTPIGCRVFMHINLLLTYPLKRKTLINYVNSFVSPHNTTLNFFFNSSWLLLHPHPLRPAGSFDLLPHCPLGQPLANTTYIIPFPRPKRTQITCTSR